MSKTSFKNGLVSNKVFAIPMGTDPKTNRTTKFRIVNKKGKTIRIAKNGLSV